MVPPASDRRVLRRCGGGARRLHLGGADVRRVAPERAAAQPARGDRARRPGRPRRVRRRRAPPAGLRGLRARGRARRRGRAHGADPAHKRRERAQLRRPDPRLPGLRDASTWSRTVAPRSWPGAAPSSSRSRSSATSSPTTTGSSKRSSTRLLRGPRLRSDLGVFPRPVQDPLPVWVAVGGAPESAASGRLGLPMALAIIGGMPERFAPFAELHRAAPRPGTSRRALSINSHGFVAETSRTRRQLLPPFADMMPGSAASAAGRRSRARTSSGRTLRGATFVGSPEEVVEKILFQHEIFGHQRFLVQFSRRLAAARRRCCAGSSCSARRSRRQCVRDRAPHAPPEGNGRDPAVRLPSEGRQEGERDRYDPPIMSGSIGRARRVRGRDRASSCSSSTSTVVVFVYWRRLRLAVHEKRAERVRAQLAPVIAAVSADASPADRQRLRVAVADLDARSRPIAAALLIDRLERGSGGRSRCDPAAAPRGRARSRSRSSRCGRGRPGGARSAAPPSAPRVRARRCPLLEELLHDRNHHVREAAVEALGAIGEPASLPALRELYLAESVARPGIVYAALVEFGPAAVDIFAEGIRSENPRVRASACFGLAGGRPRRGCPRTSVLVRADRARARGRGAGRPHRRRRRARQPSETGPAPADLLTLVADSEPRRPARRDARARRLRRPPGGGRRRRCVAGRASARSRCARPSPSCCWRRKPRGRAGGGTRARGRGRVAGGDGADAWRRSTPCERARRRPGAADLSSTSSSTTSRP